MTSNEQVDLAQQYGTTSNLEARIALHERFSVNTYGWSAWVFEQFDLSAECHILEVGCGTGGLWQNNRERIPAGWRLVLTDASAGMLETTRNNLEGLEQLAEITLAEAQSLPYADASFDAVIANNMLYHVPVLATALSEIHRVLKSGSALYATTLGEQQNRELYKALAPFANEMSATLNPEEIHTRFSLENGRSRLEPWFIDIQLRRYADAFRVTEVDPLVAYVQSLTTSKEPVLSGDGLHQFRDYISVQIATHGAFHITKDNGIFAARKKVDA